MTDCRLCAELNATASAAPWNRPLIETANFVVIPSLGALVQGWLLLIPKEHHISFGALPPELRDEADGLARDTRAFLCEEYDQPVLTFEHGPSAANHGTGCGVDHAHLHLVPLACDLLAQVKSLVPSGLSWQRSGWGERKDAYSQGMDYLYLQPDGQEGLIAVADDFGSQVFRRAIARFLGRSDCFSWREYPQLEIVEETIATVGQAVARTGGRQVHAA